MQKMLALTKDDIDQLSEMVNIGISHAGTALSVMLGKRVTISVPVVEIKTVQTVPLFVDQPNELTVSVLLRLAGGLDGYVFLFFPHAASTRILRVLTGKAVTDLRALDAYDRSIFQELGNVITGGMLLGLSKFLNTQLLHSVPDVVIDMSGPMFNSIAAAMFKSHDEFISLDVAVCVDAAKTAVQCDVDEEARGRMYIFIGPPAVEKILAATRRMVNQ